MTQTFTRKQTGLAVACALALGIAAGAARADIKPADAAYLTDARNSVVMSGYELCWHTGTGPAPISTIECDPNFVPAPVAKVIVKPTPEPVVVAVVTPEP